MDFSFKKWEALCRQQRELQEQKKDSEKVTQTCIENLKKLCRVCGSNGFVSITTIVDYKLLHIQPSVDRKLWDIPVSAMISDISGEEVSDNDALPQFICVHCLSYLHHAYEIRLRIRATASNLREVIKISCQEPIDLEEKQIDQTRHTKREVLDFNEEIEEEKHFYELFQGSNLKISQPKQTKDSVLEYKCPSCKQRLMSVSSLNAHMDNCIIHTLETFFSQFYHLYNMKATSKIPKLDYIFRALRLIDSVNQNVQKYIIDHKIDIKAISQDVPTFICTASVVPPSPQKDASAKRNQRFQTANNTQATSTPQDNGYFSGGAKN